jgi:membrane fusion protein, heavy metal efflux system
MKNTIFILLMAASITLTFYACRNTKPQEGDPGPETTISGDTVIVRGQSTIFSKLTIKHIIQQDYYSENSTTGTVRPVSGKIAEISSPFEGRISRSYVKLGQKVASGAPLFEVSSAGYSEAVSAFLEARQALALSRKNYLRKKDLAANGVSSQKELEEAETDFRFAEKDLEKAEMTLHIFNAETKGENLSGSLIIRSPIRGEVVKNNITVGQYLRNDEESLVTVADLDKVWVVARVKEKNIHQISRQDKVRVYTESLPDQPVSGLVDYIGNMMDEQTRSVEVYIECENQDRMLKPGMFVTISFAHLIKNAIVVPSTAVLMQEDKSFVFMQAGDHVFIRKQVTVFSNGSDKNLIISSGIESGSAVVAEGGIYLR